MKELIYHRLLVPSVTRHASEVAFTDHSSGATVTFAEHLSSVCRVVSGLKDLGVSRDRCFAVMALNSHAYVQLWHAAMLGGGVISPLNLRLGDHELAEVLADSEAEVCFVDQTFAGTIDRVRARTSLKAVVLVDTVGEDGAPCDLTFHDLVAEATDQLPEEPEETDPAVIMYTGGTTGRPKGVVLDQRAEVLNQYHFAMAVPWDSQGAFLIQTPMFHGASMLGVLGAPAFGVPSVILPTFHPTAAVQALEKHGVGTTVMVPTMIQMLLDDPTFSPERLASWRRLVYGASPMPAGLLDRLLELLPDLEVIQGYGMTEGATILTTLSNQDHRSGTQRQASAGRPLPGVELCTQDPEGRLLDPGQVGEVCARGGNFMQTYWHRPDETSTALRGGWYHSGDAGYLDDRGYLFLVDRLKDMIVSGGENIYCVEIESAISTHPAVAQVAVIGIPDDRWGEAVHAIVVPKPGCSLTAAEVIEHTRGLIAGYKTPKSVAIRTDPLPLSPAMKVLKRELRAPFWQGQARAIH
jgi:acyl-CoA synthetase (AMP-forming)/AMP-acid ligase II